MTLIRDCWLLIFQKLSWSDKANCRLVCKNWRDWIPANKFKLLRKYSQRWRQVVLNKKYEITGKYQCYQKTEHRKHSVVSSLQKILRLYILLEKPRGIKLDFLKPNGFVAVMGDSAPKKFHIFKFPLIGQLHLDYFNKILITILGDPCRSHIMMVYHS